MNERRLFDPASTVRRCDAYACQHPATTNAPQQWHGTLRDVWLCPIHVREHARGEEIRLEHNPSLAPFPEGY